MINGSILKRRISAIARLTVLIPLRATHGDITLPGFMEADTVRRSGSTLAGDFVWSLPVIRYPHRMDRVPRKVEQGFKRRAGSDQPKSAL